MSNPVDGPDIPDRPNVPFDGVYGPGENTGLPITVGGVPAELPEFNLTATWPRAAVYSLVLLGISLLVLAGTSFYQARSIHTANRTAERIEVSAECRFDENVEISNVNDEIDLWTARGLSALARDDEPGLIEALSNIDRLTAEFSDIIEARGNIAENCSTRSAKEVGT